MPLGEDDGNVSSFGRRNTSVVSPKFAAHVILSVSEESGVGEYLPARCFTEFTLSEAEGFSMTARRCGLIQRISDPGH